MVWWLGGSVVGKMSWDEVASTSFDLEETSATGEKLQVFGVFSLSEVEVRVGK